MVRWSVQSKCSSEHDYSERCNCAPTPFLTAGDHGLLARAPHSGQRGAELPQRLAALGRDVLEVELAVGDLEERLVRGEQRGLGGVDLAARHVAEVAAHELGLGLVVVLDEEAT